MFSRKLNYKSLPNIRDLGGMRTDDGRQIKSGKLIRSGHLSGMPEEELAKLSGLAGAVIDFRTDNERLENPDAQIADAAYYHIPIVESFTPGVSREEDSDKRVVEQLLFKPGEARDYMIRMYRAFAGDYAVAGYADFVRLLLQGNKKAVLWHCTAGKDRAGMATAIVLEALGVPRETIVADYLKTNEYLKEDIAFLTAFIKRRAKVAEDDMVADEALRYHYGANVSFIESFYAAIDERFGSVDAYLCDGLKLSEAEIAAFRNITLE